MNPSKLMQVLRCAHLLRLEVGPERFEAGLERGFVLAEPLHVAREAGHVLGQLRDGALVLRHQLPLPAQLRRRGRLRLCQPLPPPFLRRCR